MQPKPKQPFESLPTYMTDSEVTVVDLAKDGMPCIPVLGQTHYSRRGDGTDPHVHPGMIEVLYCRRGEELSFDSAGKIVPFRVTYCAGVFTLWCDGVKIGENLGIFDSGSSYNYVRLGVVSTSNGGSYEIDYIRWTTDGAFVPYVPPKGTAIVFK